jgi:hypothetical protein
MIGVTRYVRCDGCFTQMLGILSPDARETCHGCGGHAIIGERASYQRLVRRAKERCGRSDPPRPKPRSPGPRRSFGMDAA